MKLAIDAFNISLAQGTGVATYGRNLVRAATGLGHDAGLLFGTRAGRTRFPLLNEIALTEGASTGGRKSWPIMAHSGLRAVKGIFTAHGARHIPLSGQVIMPYGLQLDPASFWNVKNLYSGADIAFRAVNAFTHVSMPGIDLAHWTYPMPLRIRGARNVYTLHDLVPLRLPYATADVKRVYYRLCKRIARRADHILTVSECSRRDIIEILGVDEDRVTNLYQSSDISRLLNGVTDDDISIYLKGLIGVERREYFLFFGAIEPKKNLARMLEAYLGSGSNTPLVIVGAPGWGSDRDVALLDSLVALDRRRRRARRRIIWLGYLPRQMLARLIAGAKATLFPSLYEGFGLPVLESMALGTPVMTSRISSLPEVGGDAALYADPYDVQSMTAAIRALDADPDLRSGLAELGLRQAEQFSAAAYRNRLAGFYESMR